MNTFYFLSFIDRFNLGRLDFEFGAVVFTE